LFETREEYIQEFKDLDLTKPSLVKLNRGLEVDFSPRFLDRVGDFVNKVHWDILLCSVHEFGDGQEVEKKLRTNDLTDHRNRWETYFRLQTKALESSFVPFKILAHPIRLSKGTTWIPEDIDEMLTALSAVAKKNDKALELNGNDLDYNPRLVRSLAYACSKRQCRVSIGSDAHYPQEVFRNLDTAMRLVEEFKLEVT